MKFDRQSISIALVVGIGAILALVILRMEKAVTADPHDHGHGDHHGDAHGESHGDGHGKRAKLDAEALRTSGIVLDTVGPALIRISLPLNGVVQANQDKVARMMPRFAGVVKETRRQLGNKVSRGEVLAIIESNESLAAYAVTSQMAGTIIQKNVNPGEFVNEKDVLYTVADLSLVWVDLHVHSRDFDRLHEDQEVMVKMDREAKPVKGRISYLSPIGSENTQTMLARMVIPNTSGLWRPGLYVDGEVTMETDEAPMAVSEKAIQTLDGTEVVFVQEGGFFEAREIEFGARDGEWAEVISGVGPGDVYASENSFIIKAEIGKGEAKHEH